MDEDKKSKEKEELIKIITTPENAEMIIHVFQTIDTWMKSLSRFVSEYRPKFQRWGKEINDFLHAFREFVDTCTPPEDIYDKLSQYEEKCAAWGKCGWTPPTLYAIEELYQFPPTPEEADQIMMQYIDREGVASFLAYVKDTAKDVLNDRDRFDLAMNDIDEAEFCFVNMKYKSCTMMLYALIEGQLIRMQEISSKRRPIGKNAMKIVAEQIKQATMHELMFYHVLLTNVYECVLHFFEDANDFHLVTRVANRNYVDHGMIERPVTKTDCLQLFSLFANLMLLLSMMDKE